MGLDSSDLLNVSAELESCLGRTLYPTLLYEQGSAAQLACWLRSEGISTLAATNVACDNPGVGIAGNLTDFVARVVRMEAGLAALPDVDIPFYDLGLDSGALMALSRAFEQHFGKTFYPTLCYEYGSVRALADHFSGMGLSAPGTVVAAAESATVRTGAGLFRATEVWERAPLPKMKDCPGNWAAVGKGAVLDGLPQWQGQTGLEGVVWVAPEGPADALLDAALGIAQRLVEARQALRLVVIAPDMASASALVPFFRTMARETPRLSGRIVTGAAHDLRAELAAPEPDRGFEWIDHGGAAGTRMRQALALAPAVPLSHASPVGGAIVITGAQGAVAQHLLDAFHARGHRRFCLIGRRAASGALSAKLRHLVADGTEIQELQADIADGPAMEQAWKAAKARFGSIGGILHCAGLLRDGFLADKSLADAQTVLAVKLPPLQQLDMLSRGEPLAFFAACGSITGVIGNVGQADYAFANGAMAGFLAERARLVAMGERAGASLCMNWPLWAEGGMAPDTRRAAHLAAETGLAPLPTDAAVAAFYAALTEPGDGRIMPLMIETGAEARFKGFADGTGLAMAGAESVPARPGPVPAQEPKAQPEPVSGNAPGMPVAVIGMAGEYPGARDLNEFWTGLLAGQDAITPVPQDRWDHAALLGDGRGARGKVYASDGGFIADHDRFDAAFFNIPPREARLLDPQERRFLQIAWQTVESAGLNPKALDGAAVGVFVGAMWGQYQLQGADAEGSVAASIYAAIANRVSYSLNLTGPSFALDSMCSSSLSALHLAMESLRRGECRMAIAGGVNLMSHPHKYRFLCQNQMLSDDGRCRSFGEGGNGYVPGEGVGAVLLKPLDRALADGDPVQAVLLASALNHGGRGAGMTVPSPAAQAKVIRRAHEAAGTLDRVSYIEAHGTGTALGDPIEVEGIRQAFAGSGQTDCALGSVKSNIGHLEGAAGIAALAKVVLQLRHGLLVPSLHSDTPNARLRLEDSALHLQHGTQSWQGADRIAGISAFGAGGSNAHLVVGAAPETGLRAENGPALLVISARDDEALRRYASRWIDYLKGAVAQGLPFSAIAGTSVTGRAQMACRLALMAGNHAEAAALLSEWLDGKAERGLLRVPGLAETAADLALQEKASAFLSGEPLTAEAGPRVEIPVYPFGGDRYWLDAAPVEATVAGQPADPLLHRLRPALDGVGYDSRWMPGEPLLEQHVIAGRPLMPAAMMLETARRALAVHIPGARIALAVARIGLPFGAAPEGAAELSTSVFAHGRGLAVELRPMSSEAIVLQAQSAVTPQPTATMTPPEAVEQVNRLYEQFSGAGLEYGPLYRCLTATAYVGSACWARIGLTSEPGWRRNVLAMDAAMQAVVLCGNDLAGDDTAWLPSEFEGVEWHGETADAVWAVAEPLLSGPARRCYALTLTDASGTVLWRAERFTLRPVPKFAATPVDRPSPTSAAVAEPVGTQTDSGALRDALRSCLCDLLAAESGLSADQVRRENAFAALGVDSVMVMKMTFTLEEKLGSLPKSLFFDCPGINELTDWLLTEKAGALPALVGDGIAGTVSTAVMPKTAALPRGVPMLTSLRKKAAEAVHQEPLAVIGMAGRFPDADGVDALWENLASGRNSVRRIPQDRWPADLFRNEDGRKGNICDFGGFLADVAGFDADFFGMTPIDAKRADPAERIILETAWSAAEDAGYSRKALKGRPVGVFVASMWQQYQHFGLDVALRGEQMSAVSLLSSTASRISGMLGVNGPCLALDTMCSGGLTALHLARQAIASGDCEAAIVGGVNLSLHPHKYLTLSAGGFLSRAGHCAAFGATADGYVPGEGSACIMVKPLSRALADGDPVHGVILGTAINHIGTVNGSTIPSAASQAKVITSALEAAGIDPRQVSYVEAHGTGTALGDPIELEGLDSALNADGTHPGCHLGSVKSNLGHAEAAAGMIGIVKVLMQFRHEKLAPTLHIQKTNPVLELDRKPFHLVDRLQDWNPGAEKFAAVSAFGAGGSNANVILQSPPRREATAFGTGPYLFALSARGDAQLHAQISNLRGWLARNPLADLRAVSATLLLGREDQPRRIALLAGDHTTLLARLDACLEGRAHGAEIFAGGAETGRAGDLFDDAEGQAMVRRLVENRRLAKL
ncbi:MAG: SDR family NAD(P)-dependent oxidoreductase, partial [Paracoccaceae bacterium]